ncbi:MAG TPA: D-2-hydroxyacid dehydrogenase [candidate division Zixibacteria bacterium]|nr:D-2-hydroxyacid dehydrogenase [candidate division Zixibacteria bacterium]
MDQPHRGGRSLTAPSRDGVVILATPIFGAPLAAEHIGRIEAVPGVRVVPISREGVVHADDPEAALAAARVVLRGGVPASVLDHLLTRAPNVEWIHSFSAGVERVATPSVRERELTVTNARGVFSRPIAEYVVMWCLAIARRLPQLLELQRERTWQPLRGRELGSLTIGIVGYGSIGSEIARLVAPFETRVIATRRRPELGAAEPNVRVLADSQLEELLRASDVVVIAAPLTEATAGLIGASQLQEMRRSAWLINIARGRLIDELALRRALEAGWIAGAVLDVFNEEPLPPDSVLYDTPNLYVTPHTSWSSDRVVERSIDLFVENLRRFVAGQPLENVVDLEAGY